MGMLRIEKGLPVRLIFANLQKQRIAVGGYRPLFGGSHEIEI